MREQHNGPPKTQANTQWPPISPIVDGRKRTTSCVELGYTVSHLSCRYTVRCNRADIAVKVSSYNDNEPWSLHGLTHATCHSDWRQRAGYMPMLYKIRGFTPTDSAITLHTHKLWHRRYFLNREVPYWLQSSITGSAFRGLLLILQNNSMLTDTKIFRSRMGAFMCIVTPYPSRVRNRIRWRSF